MSRKLILTRDVSKSECPWLEIALRSGSSVYEYTGQTHGCFDTTKGVARMGMPDQTPFFEVPRDALDGLEVEVTIGDIMRAIAGEKELPESFYDNLEPHGPSAKSLKRDKEIRKIEWARKRALRRKLNRKKPLELPEVIDTGIEW